MKIRRIMMSVTMAGCIISGLTAAHAAVYEASTLHNAVARSETVQDLFFKRWEQIQEKELYFDLYGKLNWVPGFQINAYNSGSSEYEAVDMTLVRTYGSITINYPILGGYDSDTAKRRMARGARYTKKEEDAEEGSGPMGLWKPKNLIVGFTATGFHYGLTRSTTIDRGSGVGSETVTDYKYSQFFDDIFALSLLYRPYFFIHGGIIINNQIEPNDDGTMDYGNSSNLDTRYFVGSNFLSFLNVNATATGEELEALAVGIQVNQLMGFFMNLGPYVPKLTITVKKLNLFNDEAFDAVWVKSSVYSGALLDKDSNMPDNMKEQAQLQTLSFTVTENLFEVLFIDLFLELQRANETLIEKRTGQEVELDTMREFSASLGYDIMHKNPKQNLIVSFGISRYWDLGIPIHRTDNEAEDVYTLWGGFFDISWEAAVIGADLKMAWNDSSELRKLVETSDKFMIEGSLFIRI